MADTKRVRCSSCSRTSEISVPQAEAMPEYTNKAGDVVQVKHSDVTEAQQPAFDDRGVQRGYAQAPVTWRCRLLLDNAEYCNELNETRL